MQNLLILFNPYYQKDVIDSHIAILKDRGAVGFGKIKSKPTFSLDLRIKTLRNSVLGIGRNRVLPDFLNKRLALEGRDK